MDEWTVLFVHFSRLSFYFLFFILILFCSSTCFECKESDVQDRKRDRLHTYIQIPLIFSIHTYI